MNLFIQFHPAATFNPRPCRVSHTAIKRTSRLLLILTIRYICTKLLEVVLTVAYL